MNENQHIEWKSIWKDEYLKWVCGFANAEGGTMYIGLDDEGQVVGIDNPKKLLEDLPNKIRDILGIMAKVNLHAEGEKHFIEITIEPYSTPISYRGHYYYRTGSTIQDLKGPALEKLLLKKMGKKWDGVAAPDFSLNDLSPNAFEIFRKKARKSKRVPDEDLNDTDENLLQSLGLLSGSELKRAAVIAFGKKPEQLITGAYVKIGFFRTHTDLLYQDEIHGSLFEQVEKTMDLLLTKYMKAHITYDGLTRVETYNFPEKALREAILNALIHKDYSSANPIQISVYENWLMIYNNGDLPKGWTTETLKIKHTSEPANPDIAKAFFRAGYIETWGRGTTNIVKYCTQQGLPEPVFEGKWGGIAVIFIKQQGMRPWEESDDDVANISDEFRKDFGKISERMRKDFGKDIAFTFQLITTNPFITIGEIAGKTGKTTRTIENYLKKLKDEKLITRKGPKLGGYWEILFEDEAIGS